jgi:hypothetical protein
MLSPNGKNTELSACVILKSDSGALIRASSASCGQRCAMISVHILCWGNLDAGTVLFDRIPACFIIDHLGIRSRMIPPRWQHSLESPGGTGQAAEPGDQGRGARCRRSPILSRIWDPLARI